MSGSNVAAFFDLDRTLLRENSASIYIKNEYQRKRIGLGTLVKAGFYLALYHFSLVDMERAIRKGFMHLKGHSPEELQEYTHRWFHEQIAHLLLPGARAALDWHRDQGHPLVLLTSSTEFLAREVVDAWDLDDWLANQFPHDDEGLLTGEITLPICYGKGKIHWAEQWAKEHRIDLGGSYFYTDSNSDLPMLEQVAHPRVINPDPRLRRAAHKRGWPVLDWSCESQAVVTT